ncbi:MlaE family ABC transporter permease [Rhodococcus sp. 3Y1]
MYSGRVALAGPMRELGQFYRMGADVAVGLFRNRFQVQEFLEQSWMIARVSIVPTVLVAVPFTVLVSFTLNILLREIGAADLSGAGAALGAVTQVGPVVTVLIVAGAGATAIAADLGSRTIREEIDAMEVLGIDPITRLVIPRVVASTVVALLLNGLVCVIGIAGGYAFSVFLQGVNPGAFVEGITLLTGLPEVALSMVKLRCSGCWRDWWPAIADCRYGVGRRRGEAVNETVVYAFMALFVVNTIVTAVGIRLTAG